MKKKKGNLLQGIVIMFIIISSFGIATSSAVAKKDIKTEIYIVNENDTIWNIAKKICKKNKDKDLNIQNVIIQIKKVNNFSNSDIYVGQTLKLPIY